MSGRILVVSLVVASTIAVTTVARALAARWPRFPRMIWVAVALVFYCGALWLGRRAGGEMALDALQPRFALLWPTGLQSLQAPDRALVLKAAIKCQLINVQLTVDDVTRCLRTGARLADEHDPEKTVTNRLEHLLLALPLSLTAQKREFARRLSLVWTTGFSSLEASDAELVLQAADRCALLSTPAVREDVERCLRAGAREADSHDAEMTVTNRIEQLLRAAPERSPRSGFEHPLARQPARDR